MQLDDLHEEIKIELDLMSAIVNELLSFQKDVKERTPTVCEKISIPYNHHKRTEAGTNSENII